MRSSPATGARHASLYALEALHALPCGCVAAVFISQPGEVEVVSLEARGPHCLYAQHRSGEVLGMGMGDDRLSR